LLIPNTGVFAGERMEAGTFLGIYSGELITEATGDARRLVFTQDPVWYRADDEWHSGYMMSMAARIFSTCVETIM
jgi:hypothetical protein